MCMADDAERCTVLALATTRARKPHSCAECRRRIETGEWYQSERLLFDGTVSTHKTCTHCIVARDWLAAECGGWIYGGVEEDLREHAYEGYPMAVRRLAVGMGWKWRTPKGRLLPVPAIPLTTHQRLLPGEVA